jgi:hypothetical protein
VDQAKSENQGLLRHLQKCRFDPNLDAIIAFLLLVWVKFKTKAAWVLLEFARLAQTMLLECMNLRVLLGLSPPDNPQPVLFN